MKAIAQTEILDKQPLLHTMTNMTLAYQARPITTIFARSILLLNALLFSTLVWSSSLTTSADRTLISEGETLTLTVRFDSQTPDTPDLSPLEHHFEILSRSQQNNFSLINGNSTSYTEWLLTLLPKKTGKLLIPSLRLKGAVSDAIEITVNEQKAQSTDPQPVIIETELDQSEVYVQAQLLLTLRIKHAVAISGINADELTIDHAQITKLDNSEYRQRINGTEYNVIELKFAIFPEKSGTLTIPSLRFDIHVPDRSRRFSDPFMSRRTRLLVLRSDKKTVQINPRPQNAGSGNWLPSQGISISEKWSRPLDELTVGEPITRTLHVTAQGLTGVQLPPLSHEQVEGVKIYPEQPQMSDDVTHQGVIGTRSEAMAIVPARSGEIILPAITLEWWDTKSNQLKTTVLESRTLQVKPNTELVSQAPTAIAPQPSDAMTPFQPDSTEPPAAEDNPQQFMLLLSMALNVALFTALIYTQIKFSRVSVHTNTATGQQVACEASLFEQLESAAKSAQPQAFRDYLQQWARAFWQQPSQVSLHQIANLAEDCELAETLRALDASLYRENVEPVTKETLMDILVRLKTLRQNRAEIARKNSDNALKPLYENS
jgi:hypothetical protein